MPKFNASQREAIDARNRNILFSAAAGSGKTTVMVEKIRETLIRDSEASISQFLVITFTRDAAQHMKDKLRELLEQAAREGSNQAARALSEIETASISTIHSFCTQLLKPHFLPMAAEVPFGMADASGRIRIPAIQIRTEDGETVAFSGRIDRIDALETAGGEEVFPDRGQQDEQQGSEEEFHRRRAAAAAAAVYPGGQAGLEVRGGRAGVERRIGRRPTSSGVLCHLLARCFLESNTQCGAAVAALAHRARKCPFSTENCPLDSFPGVTNPKEKAIYWAR